MGIPNTVTKFVNKNNKIADFKIEKITNSILKCIQDVEKSHESGKGNETRASKYAEKIVDRIYKEYYALEWLKRDFLTKYINFEKDERYRRLDSAFVAKRLTFVLLKKFEDQIAGKNLSIFKKELILYIKDELLKTKLDSKYTDGLFPSISKEEIDEIAEYLSNRVLEMSNMEESPELLCPTREYIQDTIEKVLKDIGEVEVAEGYMIYREGRRKIHAGDISEIEFSRNGIHSQLVSIIRDWNIQHECDSIFALNDWVYGRDGKDIRELISLSEKRYYNDVEKVAKDIIERWHRDKIKFVIIAGPSSSNKTTTTVIIGNLLEKEGIKLKGLNVDDYFKDLENQPKDEFGDYDFEMPDAIDMELLNYHLAMLMDNHTIHKPHYNFITGKRDRLSDFSTEPDEIILIDCLHGLSRALTSSVPAAKKYKIYIESMNIIRGITASYTRWADVRMLKRMIRDVQHRGYSTEKTLSHWPYVRKGELKHIIPYINSTDAVINSGLPYELPVLKTALKDLFPSIEYIDSLRKENRLDPYIRGIRTKTLLDTITALDNLDLIPGTSPIREFIGGSTYVIPHND